MPIFLAYSPFKESKIMNIDDMVLKIEIADRLNQESYNVWDRARVIKNQDYHDGVVKGLKMAANLVRKL